MRERYILAPGAKGKATIKNLALHGVNCINLKIVSAGELARTALMKSGVSIEEEFVSSREERTFIAKAVAGESYFGRTTYSDIKQIANSIKRMRSLVVDGEEETVLTATLQKGLFEDKNAALLSVYKKYIALLKAAGALDNVLLIRKAIAESKEMDAEFNILSEYPLNPLEKALLNKLSGGKVTEISLNDLYKVSEQKFTIESIRNCYGAPNEVETILNDIYAGKKNLDACTVALADTTTYAQLFFDYALLYDIPVSFGCGIPIVNANPARLLVLYYHWITDGFFGADAITELLGSKAFNRAAWNEQFEEITVGEKFSLRTFYEVLGKLRLTNDRETNRKRLEDYKRVLDEEEQIIRAEDEKAYKDLMSRKECIPYLEVAARELSILPEDFIMKYSYIRKGSGNNAEKLLMQLDMSAVGAIYEELSIIRKAGIEQSTDDLIKNVLRLGLGGESGEEGKLYITDLNGALSGVRDNLYIAGLSANHFPGSPKENYLLLDADLKLFGEEADRFTSEGKIKQKREQLFSLVRLAENLGSSLNISYAGLDVSELKRANASSCIFELYRMENGQNATAKELEEKIEKIDYFAPAISKTREVGKAYDEGKNIGYIIENPDEYEEENDVATESVEFDKDDKKAMVDRAWSKQEKKGWSPSAINLFFKDPESFMRIYMLGIPDPEDEKPFTVVTPIEIGNLAHALMERMANTDMTKEDFLQISAEAFDRYMVEKPPLIAENIPEAKSDFLDVMGTSYDMNPHREVVLKEENIVCAHPSGITLAGFPDCVEKLEDGSLMIVDYKSGRKIDHEKDDINTCLQVVIYAYMMEQQGYNVAGGEFRYIRLGETITCVYNEGMKLALDDKLTQFKEALENFDFEPINPVLDDDESEEE